jgi:hypothetical protein
MINALADDSRFEPNQKRQVIDSTLNTDVIAADFANTVFIRLVAKERTFRNVDFRFCVFDGCYLRSCQFDSCTFTGCRFIGSNFEGSRFAGSEFDYAVFERTNITPDILDTEAPATENMQRRFARALRVNYQQLGDAQSVNKAIGLELKATEIHLHKAWHSREAYYRAKYRSWERVWAFLEWLEFKTLDILWGNGESLANLIRSICLCLIAIGTTAFLASNSPPDLKLFANSLFYSPAVLFGTLSPTALGPLTLAAIVALRTIGLAMLIAILVKRFSRR